MLTDLCRMRYREDAFAIITLNLAERIPLAAEPLSPANGVERILNLSRRAPSCWLILYG
jgi:hypothetical protein